MADQPDPIRPLNLFVQRAGRLVDSNFLKSVQELGGVQVHYQWSVNKGSSLDLQAPPIDDVEGFLLNLRMLIQDNDALSIHNIERLLLEVAPNHERTKDFCEARASLNEYLDHPIIIKFNGEQPTRRDVLWAFMYGHYAHVNQGHEEALARWLSHDFGAGYVHMAFYTTLLTFVNTAAYLARCVQAVIDELA